MIKKKLISEYLKANYNSIPTATFKNNGLQSKENAATGYYDSRILPSKIFKLLEYTNDSFAVFEISCIHVYGNFITVRLYIMSITDYGKMQIRSAIESSDEKFNYLRLFYDKETRCLYGQLSSPVFYKWALLYQRNATLCNEVVDINVEKLTEITWK